MNGYIRWAYNYLGEGAYIWVSYSVGFYGTHDQYYIIHEIAHLFLFVEPECKVITGLLTEKQIDVVISFHSGGRYIVIPVCNGKYM